MTVIYPLGSGGDLTGGALSEAELNAALIAADSELLKHIKDRAHPHEALLAMMKGEMTSAGRGSENRQASHEPVASRVWATLGRFRPAAAGAGWPPWLARRTYVAWGLATAQMFWVGLVTVCLALLAGVFITRSGAFLTDLSLVVIAIMAAGAAGAGWATRGDQSEIADLVGELIVVRAQAEELAQADRRLSNLAARLAAALSQACRLAKDLRDLAFADASWTGGQGQAGPGRQHEILCQLNDLNEAIVLAHRDAETVRSAIDSRALALPQSLPDSIWAASCGSRGWRRSPGSGGSAGSGSVRSRHGSPRPLAATTISTSKYGHRPGHAMHFS